MENIRVRNINERKKWLWTGIKLEKFIEIRDKNRSNESQTENVRKGNWGKKEKIMSWRIESKTGQE